MADAASTPGAKITPYGDYGATVNWGPITGVATSKAADMGAYGAHWTLQVSGTYGGSTWTLQGSNDGVTWFTLNDTSGTAVPATFSTGDKLLNIKERPKFVRIISTGGTGTALVATLNCITY